MKYNKFLYIGDNKSETRAIIDIDSILYILGDVKTRRIEIRFKTSPSYITLDYATDEAYGDEFDWLCKTTKEIKIKT